MDQRPTDLAADSWLAAGGRPTEPGSPLNAPIVAASNFLLDDGGAGTSYARGDSTATWAALEVLLGGLESATALSFASGMAAISSVFDLLPAGAHVVVPADCYQGVAGVVDEGVAAGRWTAER
ncbi:MAG: PLP-dependent transferase, partial [Ilumatobacteraceae bacterium]